FEVGEHDLSRVLRACTAGPDAKEQRGGDACHQCEPARGSAPTAAYPVIQHGPPPVATASWLRPHRMPGCPEVPDMTMIGRASQSHDWGMARSACWSDNRKALW